MIADMALEVCSGSEVRKNNRTLRSTSSPAVSESTSALPSLLIVLVVLLVRLLDLLEVVKKHFQGSLRRLEADLSVRFDGGDDGRKGPPQKHMNSPTHILMGWPPCLSAHCQHATPK